MRVSAPSFQVLGVFQPCRWLKRPLSVCNMSFGEDAAWALEDRGQFIAMLRDEVIKKRNVIFVAAAGNAGKWLLLTVAIDDIGF